MIKYKGECEGKPVYGFGLSEGNLQKLRQGLPIEVDLEPMGGVGFVHIIYGETEQAILEMFQAAGCIAPDCTIHEQKRQHEG